MTDLVSRSLLAFAATATVMVALDLLWLGLIARPLYQQGVLSAAAGRAALGWRGH